MVTSNEEDCLLMCKLTSMATERSLALCNIHLEINPDYAEYIQEIEKVCVED
jgi:hypothetical protein